MAYKIQPLVEANYDFAKLYSDKQEAVRMATGLDFNLENIVKFLQRQTNNFTVDNPVAHDLDDAIFNIVNKYKEESKEEPIEPMKLDEATEKEIRMEAIEMLELLGDSASEEEKEALELLKSIED